MSTDDGEQVDMSIVVGVDRSPGSAVALEAAITLAVRLRASLHVLHVLSVDDTPTDPDGPGWEAATADTVRAEGDAVRQVLASSALPDWSWHQHDWHGDPAATLVSLARQERACMIVVGAHPRDVASRLHALVDGSVVRRLVEISPTPVLVVPRG